MWARALQAQCEMEQSNAEQSTVPPNHFSYVLSRLLGDFEWPSRMCFCRGCFRTTVRCRRACFPRHSPFCRMTVLCFVPFSTTFHILNDTNVVSRLFGTTVGVLNDRTVFWTTVRHFRMYAVPPNAPALPNTSRPSSLNRYFQCVSCMFHTFPIYCIHVIHFMWKTPEISFSVFFNNVIWFYARLYEF